MKRYFVQLSLAALVVLAGVTLRRVFAALDEPTGWAVPTVAIGCSPLPQMPEQPATNLTAAGASNVESLRPSFGTSPVPLPPPSLVGMETSRSLSFGTSPVPLPPPGFGTSPVPLPRPGLVTTEMSPSLNFGTSPVPLPPPGFGTSPVPLPPPGLVTMEISPSSLSFATSPAPLPGLRLV